MSEHQKGEGPAFCGTAEEDKEREWREGGQQGLLVGAFSKSSSLSLVTLHRIHRMWFIRQTISQLSSNKGQVINFIHTAMGGSLSDAVSVLLT